MKHSNQTIVIFRELPEHGYFTFVRAVYTTKSDSSTGRITYNGIVRDVQKTPSGKWELVGQIS